MIEPDAGGQLERSARKAIFHEHGIARAMMGVDIEAETVVVLSFRLLPLRSDHERSNHGCPSSGEVDCPSRRSRRAERLSVGVFVVIVAMVLREA